MLTCLAEIYRQQRMRPVHRAAALGEMLDTAAKHSISRLTKRELALGTKCKFRCDESRRFAVAGNVTDACLCVGVARAIAQSDALSDEARLLYLAEIAPAEAYMERLFDNLTTARELIGQALRLDQELEERFGHYTKIAHRVHMMTVSAAVLFQQQDAMAAIVQLAAILKYLAGVAKTPTQFGQWSQSALNRLPTGMRDVLALQAVEVLYAALTVWRGLARKALLDAFFTNLGCRARKILDQSINGTPAGDYLSLLEVSCGDECIYLICSTELLKRTQVRSLMYYISFDCACCCIECGASVKSATALVREIHRNARGQILPFSLHAAYNTVLASAAPLRSGEASA